MVVACVWGRRWGWGGVGKGWPKTFVGGKQEGPHLGTGRSQEPGNSASWGDQISNSSAVNSEIGTCSHRKSEEGEIPREDTATAPTFWERPAGSRTRSQLLQGPHLPALPCPSVPARRTGEGEKTMEPDGTQIKLDPR